METAKYRKLTIEHCVGSGLDLGSGGEPICDSALQIDQRPLPGIHLVCDCQQLPFQTETFDYVYASHIIEDFVEWRDVLIEWVRVLKVGGKIIILVPDHKLFRLAVSQGQPDNDAHKHESYLGELSSYADELNLDAVEKMTDLHDGDYTIMFVGVKIK